MYLKLFWALTFTPQRPHFSKAAEHGVPRSLMSPVIQPSKEWEMNIASGRHCFVYRHSMAHTHHSNKSRTSRKHLILWCRSHESFQYMSTSVSGSITQRGSQKLWKVIKGMLSKIIHVFKGGGWLSFFFFLLHEMSWKLKTDRGSSWKTKIDILWCIQCINSWTQSKMILVSC